jgi:hypothetical protein
MTFSHGHEISQGPRGSTTRHSSFELLEQQKLLNCEGVAPSTVDEVSLCANQSLRWPQFSRLAAYRLPLTRSPAVADTAVVTLADMAAATLPTLGGMVPVATSEVDIAVAFSRVDMAAVSGTANGGLMALVHAGNGQTLTASMCGSAINS